LRPRTGGGGERTLTQKSLGEGLGLRNEGDDYSIFRDHISGLEFIRSNRELWETGLFIELEAYRCHVFLDWRQVQDNEWGQYAHLTTYLNGRGVPSIEEALQEVFLQPIHQPFRELVNPGAFRSLLDKRVLEPVEELSSGQAEGLDTAVMLEMEARTLRLLRESGSSPRAQERKRPSRKPSPQRFAANWRLACNCPSWPDAFPCRAPGNTERPCRCCKST
jgi:hypothetical protein